MDAAVVTNLVDFADSTSADFSNSRIRSVHQDWRGRLTLERCDSDFERNLRAACPGSAWTPEMQKEMAIEHSQWFGYWRGKVSGGVTATLSTMPDRPIPEYSDSMSRHLLIAAQNPATFTEPDKYFVDMIERHVPAVMNSRERRFQRTVVMVSIAGGPVTRTEQKHLPLIGRDVLADLRRRRYHWAANCQLVLAHFESVEAMLDSFAGKRNLTVDMRPERVVMHDGLGTPTTFKSTTMSAERPNAGFSMLRRSPQEILMEVGGQHCSADPMSFMVAIEGGDLKTVDVILKSCPVMIDRPLVHGRKLWPPVARAAVFGHAELVERFKDLGADLGARIELVDDHKGDPFVGLSALGAVCLGWRNGYAPISGAQQTIKCLMAGGLKIQDEVCMSDNAGTTILEVLRGHLRVLGERGEVGQRNIALRNTRSHEDCVRGGHELLSLLSRPLAPPDSLGSAGANQRCCLTPGDLVFFYL